jgi:hypothetical protein
MQATDQVAPTLDPLPPPTIGRGYAPSGCSGSGSTCDDIGTVLITPSAMDDMTPPDGIGFRITLAGGTLPPGFTLPTGAIKREPSYAYLLLTWVDGATDDQDAIDFTLSIVAVDLAGNESAPQTVVVKDSGAGSGGSGGCRLSASRRSGPVAGPAAGPTAPAGIVLGLLGLALATRRRRGSRT